jgi:hypothetical protein
MDVTLVLKADNSQYVNKIKEAQNANQKLYDTSVAGEKREKGILQEIEDRLTSLQKKRQAAFSYEDIAKYNQKIAETKQHLQEYEQAGMKADKQTQALTQSIGKWVLTLGGAAAILTKLKDAFMQLTVGINTFNTIGAATDQVLSNIVRGTSNWNRGVTEAIRIQGIFNDLRVEEYKDAYESQKKETEFQRKWSESLDAELSAKEKIIKIDEALAAHNEAINIRMEHAIKERDANIAAFLNSGTEKFYKAAWASKQQIEALDEERYNSTKRLIRQKSTLEKQEHDEMMKRWFDEIDEQNKVYDKQLDIQKKYQDLSLKLLDDYDKSNIESLKGTAKLAAQRDFGLKQIKEFKDQLAAVGTVTEEQYAIFSKLWDNVWKSYTDSMVKEVHVTPEQRSAISKALLEGIPTADEIQKYSGNTTKGTKPASTIWELIGIDPESEEGKKQVEAINKAVDTTKKALDDIFSKRIEDTQRQRELLDTQISEAESALNTEVELYKAGYASNVDAKKKEIETLKKQREEALKNEEKAIRAQRALDTVTQVSSLITASADIFKSFAKIPVVGVPLAIGMIATMFGAFAAAKIKASSSAGFAKGGWTGEGGDKDHTGERVAGVVHGEEYVVKRGPAHRFREVLEAINKDDRRLVINRFEKLKPDLSGGTTINQVTVENEGPNKRLDQLIQLNKKRSKEEVFELGNQTIIHKGLTTRTIKK